MSKRQVQVCNAAGPWVKTSPSFESQMYCNRVAGHELMGEQNRAHRVYDPDTFVIVAEWIEPEEPDTTRKRRKVQQP